MSAAHTVPHTRILIALIGGAAVGCGLNYAFVAPGPPPVVPGWLRWAIGNVTKPVGDVFLNLLFMPIIPLVFASLAVGVTRLGGGQNVGRVGLKTLAYFLVTTACAAAVGLTLVNVIRPGDQIPPEKKQELLGQYEKEAGEKLEKKDAFGVNTFVNVVPRNPLEAFAKKDMLAVIFSALVVGIALARLDPARAKPMIDLLEVVNDVADFVLRLAMSIAPYAVFCLIFTTTAALGYKVLIALGAFIFTVLGGLALHLFVTLPLILRFLGGMSPLEFFARARGTMVTAFSTSSSSATLPTAMKCAEEELGVPPNVSRFVLPLSASMNHNGTALFESVTVLFLAQAFGVELGLGEQLQVLVLCILTATGVAGVPGGSLPLIGLILVQVHVPAGAIALVLGVDRILDMCRTMVNVTADLTTAVFVARSESKLTAEENPHGEWGGTGGPVPSP
ncbi:dicarboxylate/amino acid:cation symporter [Frigoriglobus tundricola]|uniref:Proton/sodium-glutamate symport protein n=1 Tax=Frigoriglobus tundricola TaxID=2774151 RepID=A0A6M5YVX7_9BACT|nr:dicarboxylate/amino acid:cation symporter [Frigoriglobus tundricola]QJW98089.1 Proton/sodium-glutamate symport protein [Frigoriglobus tundricola]